MDHPTLHIPSYLKSVSDIPRFSNKRLLLIGVSGHGKTYSVGMTAPNPIVCVFDNNLPPELATRQGVSYLPFYDSDWVRKTMLQSTVHDGLTKFLQHDCKKMTADQTVIIDHLSGLYDSFRIAMEGSAPKNQSDKENGYWYWKQVTRYFVDLHTIIERLTCNIVMICHENELRDTDTGKILGYRWWLPGQEFSPRLPQFYTDVFRQVRTVKQEGPLVTNTYEWQVQGTALFPPGKTTIKTKRLAVPASWDSFKIVEN